MRTSKHASTLTFAAVAIFICVSWMRNGNNNRMQENASVYDAIFSSGYLSPGSSTFDDQLSDEYDWIYNAGNPKKVPPADDVLIQKIPGDNNHLLLMAVYSYAAFHDKFVKIKNGEEDVLLKDDGTENDKVAGDGIYTAKIFADVKEFRALAVSMLKETIKNNWEPLFTDREFNYSTACDTNPFNEAKFDNNEAVSIAKLTGLPESITVIDNVRSNCILLTGLSVVEDPSRTWNSCAQTGNVDGPWTFKTLMKNLATQDPSQPASDQVLSDFVKNWLNSWDVEQIINEDIVPSRKAVNSKILDPWLAKSLNAGNPAGFLDMRFAPFKLTAIVNRFDLRDASRGRPAGEGRLVFCLIDGDCSKAEAFTVIFEYGINKPDVCDSVRRWASQWFALRNITLGSAQYLSALQALTDQFTLCGSSPNRTHQSSLDAVRTNEVVLSGNPKHWELRQFGLDNNTHTLAGTTVAKVPADKYNARIDNEDVRRMVKFVNENSAAIDIVNYDVPDAFDGFAFRGGKSTVLDTPVGVPTQPYHWNGVSVSPSPAFITSTRTRHVFSLNTCSGCHSGEVQTFFTHVDPVFFGTPATLSGFLSGTAGRGGAIDSDGRPDNDRFKVRDAANRGTGTQRFNTFNEIKRRAQDLKVVATTTCTTVFALRNELMFHPVGAVH